MAQPNKKVIFKNAVTLTLRMILVTIVGLYTSRITLTALGIDDYGIYGVIGGVIGLASFLNTSMAGATSRFITFELGKVNENRLKLIFSTSFLIHVIIATCVLILGETIGLWFVNHKMDFPVGSMVSVNILYQFTILSMFVSFTQVPFTALILAHEKMNIFAYFEIGTTLLKLGCVLLLLIIPSWRLVIYAAMTLALSVGTALAYRIYCKKKFVEAKVSWVIDKPLIREMLSYSGYDLYGNLCVSANTQGIPIILNIFFGVIANAGSSIAVTITGTVRGLTGTIFQAFRPQIIKQYAIGEIDVMESIMRRSQQFTILSYGLISIPILIESSRLLYVWLGQVPPYSSEFVQLVLIATFFIIITNTNTAAIHATGKVKWISFINGTFFLLSPIVSYLCLKWVCEDANIIYIFNILFMGLVTVSSMIIVSHQIPSFPVRQYCMAILKSLLPVIIGLILTYCLSKNLLNNLLPEQTNFIGNLWVLAKTTLISSLIIVIGGWIITFSKEERKVLLEKFAIKFKMLHYNG